MKKLFLLLLSVLVLLGGEALAQRRTVTEAIYYNGDGTTTYGYILQNGERVYDGPRKINTKREDCDRVGVDGRYYDIYTNSDLSITSNYNKGLLNGAVKVTEWERIITRAVRGYDRSEEVYNGTFSGNYVNGVPNGRFLFEGKKNEDDVVTTTGYVNATYNMGVFTGAFKYIEVYEGSSVEVSGTFSKSGKMEGKWHFITGKEYDYQFRNGIMVGGGPQPLNAKNAALATKYANGQITQKELKANNLMVREVAIPLWREYGVDCGIDLYGAVFSLLPFVDEKDVKESKVSLSTYLEVVEIPYFTDAGFESVWGEIQRELEDKKETYQSIDAVLKKYTNTDLYCMEFPNWNKPPYECTIVSGWMIKRDEYQREWWRYILTDSQLKRVKDLVESHNLAIDKQKMETYIPQIKSDYLDGVGKEITINNKLHDVVAVRMVSLDRKTGMMSVEIDSREYEQYIMGNNYILVTHRADYDGTKFQNLVPIRNKYNDIVDAKAAFNKEAESQLDKVNTLIKEKQANYLNGVTNQLTIFRNYVAQINRTQTNHNNLDATVQLFKDQTEVVKSFSGYMPQYIEACKLNEQIKQKQIAKHTSTPIPTVANWSKNAKVEMLTETIVAQQNVLKLWEQFSPLKAQVTEAHKQFGSSTDPVLSKYNAEYAALVNGKMTLEAGIEAFPKLLEEQKVVAEQWQKYKVLKAQAEKAHKQIGVTDDAVLAAYKTLYNATASKTVLAEAIEAYAKLIEEQKVVAEQWKTYSDLKWQLTDIHKQICATKLSVLGTYTLWYDANFKPQTSLEEGIATYTKLAATQKSANEYVPLYNKVVENNTLLADAIKPAKCAAKAYKLYYKGLDLNWKSEGAVEHISAVLKRQMLLLEISKFSTLKEDEKRVKKLKLTDLDEIIKAYIDNKNVAEPQIEVKAAYAVSPEQTPATAVKAERQTSEPKAKVATVKTEKKVETVPSVKAEEKPNNQPITAIKPGFGQYVEISPIFNSISSCPDTYSAHINYIAGYRFNKNLFLGVGTGLNLNFGHSTTFYDYYYSSSGSTHFDVYDTSLAMFSIPVYLHFRADFGKRAKLWNPYASISAGAQFGVFEPQQHLADRFYKGYLPGSPNFHPLHVCHTELSNHTRRNMEGFVSLDFGANRRLTDKLSIYFGVGYKVGLRGGIRATIYDYSSSIYEESALTHGIKFNVGLSF